MISLARLSDGIRHRLERRRMTPERALGRRGEDMAHRFLQRAKYRVVARGYRTPSGGNEVDLIAWDGPHLAFVEVKTRTDDDSSAPERAVTLEKQRRILRAAVDYTRRGKIDWSIVRFDVVTVVDGQPPVLALYKDAFGADPKL